MIAEHAAAPAALPEAGLTAARAAAGTAKDWMVGKALPVWSTAGFDPRRGCFEERLTFAGGPVREVPRRAMVQARQIYVFAHAAHLGWFPEGAQLAESAMDRLLRDYAPESAASGFVFSVDAEGRILSQARDAYAHAFILFAIAWLHRLNGDPRLLAVADETIRFIDRRLKDPAHPGVFDAFPVKDRAKRQNPHMHLLEAFLALEISAPGRGYLERARSLVDLFKTRLYSADAGVLLEYFAEDWSVHPDGAMSRIWEPGHQFEWIWLLREFEQLSEENLGAWIESMDLAARRRGCAESGLLFDEMATDMTPLKRSSRIWPHTEAAKAAAARHAAGDPQAADFGAKMTALLMKNFLDRPFAGGWIDHIGAEGQPLVDYVPASSLYHLFLATAELARGFPAEVQPTS